MAKRTLNSGAFLGGFALLAAGAVTLATGGLAAIPIAMAGLGTLIMGASSPSRRIREIFTESSLYGSALGYSSTMLLLALAIPTAGASLFFLPASLAFLGGSVATHAATNACEPTLDHRVPKASTRLKRFAGKLIELTGEGTLISGISLFLTGAVITTSIIATGGTILALPLITAALGAVVGGIGYLGIKGGQKLTQNKAQPVSANSKPIPYPVGGYIANGASTGLGWGGLSAMALGTVSLVAAPFTAGASLIVPSLLVAGGACALVASRFLKKLADRIDDRYDAKCDAQLEAIRAENQTVIEAGGDAIAKPEQRLDDLQSVNNHKSGHVQNPVPSWKSSAPPASPSLLAAAASKQTQATKIDVAAHTPPTTRP